MSSSSSDSDSDDYEPIRRIRINIKPKSSIDNSRSAAATIQELKASVESWRPLGPTPHPSLSRRQSSLSSVSSMSMCGLHSSPSCSSLVNEFNNRSAFSNVISPSRTSSPLTVINHGDTIPIAVAIQESIELLIKGTIRQEKKSKKEQNNSDKYPLVLQSGTSSMQGDLTAINENTSTLNIKCVPTNDTQRFNPGTTNQEEYDPDFVPEFTERSMGNLKLAFPNAFAKGAYGKPALPLRFRLNSTENITKYYASRMIHHETSQSKVNQINPTSRVFELDMDLLMAHLRKMSEQSPTSSYYNVDVLRYKIAPITLISCCPIQVCAYWRFEPEIIKLRIDLKHSDDSGIPLDRLREIAISVNLNDLLSSTKHSNGDNNSPLKCKNNNSNDTKNMNERNSTDKDGNLSSIDQSSHNFARPSPITSLKLGENVITKPQAYWNNCINQLTWKFDSLECYQNTEGFGSLFAKFSHKCLKSQDISRKNSVPYPNPIDVKFLVADSTLSKVGFSVDSAGYKMTLLKREIRSGKSISTYSISIDLSLAT